MKAKSQLKRCSEDTAKLLVSSRCSVSKEKPSAPVFIRPVARTSRYVPGLHFEFPDGERNASLTRVTSSHRRVSSTDVGKSEWGGQLMRLYNLIRTAYPSVPEVQDQNNDKLVLQHIEAGIVLTMSQLKAKEQEVEQLLSQVQFLSKPAGPDPAVLLREVDQQRRLLAGQEDELRQAKTDFDRSYREQTNALQKREEALAAREKEVQANTAQIEKDRITYATACAKMRKRVKEAEKQVKTLQAMQMFTAKSSEVQTKLKNIVKQECMLNAVAEDLQYQRTSLLAKLETTLTEIAPTADADTAKTADAASDLDTPNEPFDGVLKDCSNLLSTRDTRSRSKGSTQDSMRLYRTLSRERPVDIMEIYSEIEEERRKDPLDITPKGVLTPKSLRSSRGLFED